MPPTALSTEALRVVLGLFCRARGLFSDDCFERTTLRGDGDPLWVLRKPPLTDHGAEQLYNLVEFGVAECLDRQCMRSIVFFIVDAANGRVIEEVSMDCGVSQGEYPSATPSDALRQLTRKHRLLVQTLNPLPEKVAFAVRLTLIGSKMPYPSWSPPYFHTATTRSTSRRRGIEPQSVSLRLGKFDWKRHSCTLSIRSLQDPLGELSAVTGAQNGGRGSSQDVVFDPEFTQLPDTTSSTEPTTQRDVSLYQTIKTFVLSSAIPSMQRTQEKLSTVTMPRIRECFGRLCKEGLLERRGRRFYKTKAGVCTSNAEPKGTACAYHKAISRSPTRSQCNAIIAKRYRSHQPCWIPRAPIVCRSTKEAIVPIHSLKTRRSRQPVGGQVLLVASPIVQHKQQRKLEYSAKVGRPVFIPSTSIIQSTQFGAPSATAHVGRPVFIPSTSIVQSTKSMQFKENQNGYTSKVVCRT